MGGLDWVLGSCFWPGSSHGHCGPLRSKTADRNSHSFSAGRINKQIGITSLMSLMVNSCTGLNWVWLLWVDSGVSEGRYKQVGFTLLTNTCAFTSRYQPLPDLYRKTDGVLECLSKVDCRTCSSSRLFNKPVRVGDAYFCSVITYGDYCLWTPFMYQESLSTALLWNQHIWLESQQWPLAWINIPGFCHPWY